MTQPSNIQEQPSNIQEHPASTRAQAEIPRRQAMYGARAGVPEIPLWIALLGSGTFLAAVAAALVVAEQARARGLRARIRGWRGRA